MDFEIENQQIEDLEIIAKIDPNSFQDMLTILEEITPPPLEVSKLRKILLNRISGSKENIEIECLVQSVIRSLVFFYNLTNQTKLDAEKVFNEIEICHDLNKESNQWQEIRPIFIKMLKLPNIAIVSKALNLAFEYSNLLNVANIVTDIRPVFNDSAEKIEGALISHTLTIHYDNAWGDNVMTVAIDNEDILDLIKSCERALKKAEVAKQFMLDNEKPAIICGEKDAM